MSSFRASAPGKAVLLGEYAVLHGAPAVSMAVDRYARVDISPCEESACRVEAPQLGISPVPFRRSQHGELVWSPEPGDWPEFARTAALLEHLHGLIRQRYGDPGPFRLRIDTSELYLRREERALKLGLGSSGAVAVAVDAALRRFAGGPDETGLSMAALKRLLAPYRLGQQGQGSGVDLATSLAGGLIKYTLSADGPVVERLAPLSGLSLLFVWTGQPASTPALLRAHADWQRRSPAQAEQMQRAMQAVSARACEALGQADAESLVEQIAAYGQLMGTMGRLMGESLFSGGHDRINALAASAGVAYKPCGAGGGDIGIAAAAEQQRLHELGLALEKAGFVILPLSMDGQGVVVVEHDATADDKFLNQGP